MMQETTHDFIVKNTEENLYMVKILRDYRWKAKTRIILSFPGK